MPKALDKQVSQLTTQLAGCEVAANGGTNEKVVAKKGDYGWSSAYQAVLNLRRKYDRLVKKHGKLAERHAAMLSQGTIGQ